MLLLPSVVNVVALVCPVRVEWNEVSCRVAGASLAEWTPGVSTPAA